MSADIQSNTTRTPRPICLMTSLPESEQQVINEMLKLLPVIEIASNTGADVAHAELNIKGFVDGRGLACPMPLLKAKVGLRDVPTGESLYVIATDPNSQADIMAFCRQSKQANSDHYLLLDVNEVTQQQPSGGTPAQHFDTIYHFIITKTDSK
ncbi:sulfurtransferase TusA family protein [Psychrobacter sp.]|uniref:sulfurtransferase TusA family protein n=1 Tax=Psychrobacter sp. TaxID=56811 RepID=UPI0026565AB5|nr:sulfurtransferase TusA family protein [Psychrobacter sp.]